SAAAAEFLRMEADWEASYLLMLRAAWQADNKIPNSKEASMAKAKAGRVVTDIPLKAVELAGTAGYSEQTLLEKWARDSKIMDIFEGTQQIQQLVVARRLLGLSSAELKWRSEAGGRPRRRNRAGRAATTGRRATRRVSTRRAGNTPPAQSRTPRAARCWPRWVA